MKIFKHNLEPDGEIETPDALLNDVVLQNIFKFLGYNDLITIREVKNCQWLRNSRKAWWSRTKIIFKGPVQGERISEYLKQTDITSKAKNYKFESFRGGLERFLNKLGPSIKYLELQSCAFRLDVLRKLLYIQCPNLEKVIFEDSRVEYSKRLSNIVEPLKWQEFGFVGQTYLKILKLQKLIESKIPISWMELLSHFPNLKTLEANVDNDDIYKAISTIRQRNPRKLKLNHIKIKIESIYDFEEESIRSVLLDPNLSFEAIYMNAGHLQLNTILDILDWHAHTLKELIIDGDYFDHSLLKIPRQPLQALEELNVNNCIFPVEFFGSTPNIRKATLFDNDITKNHSMPDPNLKANTCKELTVYGNSALSLDFQIFLSVFCCVEILETRDVSNHIFSYICEHLTKLVTFIISSGSDLDVTGLLGFDPDSTFTGGIRKANITNLKDLQSFSAVAHRFGAYCWGEMKNGSVILQELEGLSHLKKFELKNYKLLGEEDIWKDIFYKYSGQ